MPWHNAVGLGAADGKRKETNLCTHTHLIKCRDEEGSSLVRGPLLMLIRRLEGYLSCANGRKKES